MNTTTLISLNKAIEEAIKFGFRNRFVHRKNIIHSLQTNEDYSDSDFAIVKSYPVILNNGHKGSIYYVVLNNGQLGFYLNETKNVMSKKEKLEDDFDSVDSLLENIYSM